MKQVNIRMPLRMLTMLVCFILSLDAFSQQITVEGLVKDAQGEPVIGATVRADGSQGGGQ